MQRIFKHHFQCTAFFAPLCLKTYLKQPDIFKTAESALRTVEGP